MIAHVAEANENSGRVVFQISAHGAVAPCALAAAVHVASSFRAGLESLVAQDPSLLEFARFDFAVEVSLDIAAPRRVTIEALDREMQSRAFQCHADVVAAGNGAGVPVQCRTLHDGNVPAIAAACVENGPWNIAVLAEPAGDHTAGEVARLFDAIADVTAIVVAGRGTAAGTSGPVVAIVEQLAHVQPMLRAAEQLAGSDDVHLIVFGGNADDLAWMDGQIRLLLGGDVAADLILTPETYASPLALAGFLQELKAGFVVARLGGELLPPGGGLIAFASAHDGPLFLVR